MNTIMKPLKLSSMILVLVFIPFLFVSCKASSRSTFTPVLPTPTIPTLTPVLPTPTPTKVFRPFIEPAEIAFPGLPTYSLPGPYTVGVATFSIQAGDNTVEACIYYPVQMNGAPDTTHSPYPLVVFSPGLGGNREGYDFFLSHLASFGFVVIASTPRGETFEAFWAGAATRPLDIELIINYAEKLTATGGQLAGLIDPGRTAIAGHSSGGWTALIGGGAQMDFGWCNHPDLVAQIPISNCPQFVPHQQEIAAMLGLESVPTGMWPPIHDPRILAVIAMAPDGDIWGAEYGGVAAMRVPALIMAGSKDTVNVPELCAYPIYEHLGSPKKTLVVFADEDHYVFGGLGSRNNIDLINHFLTAFLLAELKGDAEAAKALLPANVTFPTVKFETTVTNGK
jgi:predicted dienelactone hydrolase